MPGALLLLGTYCLKQEITAPAPKASFSDSVVDIKGFSYDASAEGRCAFRITADRLVIRKKKIGHVSVGDFCDVKLENAVVRLYGRGGINGDVAGALPISGTIDTLLDKLRLPFASSGRILSVRFAPVRIELPDQYGDQYGDQDAVAASISALSADARLNQKDILFQKNVTIVSGPRSLHADQLRLCLKTDRVQTDHRYLLETPEGRWQGKRLTTDIYLKTHDVTDLQKASDPRGFE